MDFGIDFARFTWEGGDAALGGIAADAIRMSDEGGFSTVAAMDHFFQIPVVGPRTEPMLEGYTFLGFAAGLTQQTHLQLLVTGVTYRHPGLLAKIVTTLDVLSGGRAKLGVGAAWNEEEHVGLGVPFPSTAERFERLDETLAICRQMWSDDNGPFEGRHYQLAETLNSPQNVAGPPPIMVGGMGERKTLRLAARHAQEVNWFPVGREKIEHLKGVLASYCDEEGTDADAIRLTLIMMPPARNALDAWLSDVEMYGSLGVEEIFVTPASDDPRADIEHLATEVLPRVASF
jgi:F420-dependent oxidoreductase-like protein